MYSAAATACEYIIGKGDAKSKETEDRKEGNKYKQSNIRCSGGDRMKKEDEITCTIEMTEGAEKRLTEAFVDLYYGICDGIYAGPLPETCGKDKPA